MPGSQLKRVQLIESQEESGSYRDIDEEISALTESIDAARAELSHASKIFQQVDLLLAHKKRS